MNLMALNPDAIPAELRLLDRWVVWQFEKREDTFTKVPYDAKTNQKASSTDPATWTSFGVALQAARLYAGIGFVFTLGDGIVGVDLDKCRDVRTGGIEAWAAEIVAALDTYGELSPSGAGVHLFARGTLPPGSRRKGRVEVYDSGRYFTVTGAALDGHVGVARRQSELERLHARIAANGNGHVGRLANGVDNLVTPEILAMARAAKNGAKFDRLWRGDASDYDGDQSAADLALSEILAFWVDRLFRQSSLFRAKWDERHYGDGRTYGAGTVERAVALTMAAYAATELPPPTPIGQRPQSRTGFHLA